MSLPRATLQHLLWYSPRFSLLPVIPVLLWCWGCGGGNTSREVEESVKKTHFYHSNSLGLQQRRNWIKEDKSIGRIFSIRLPSAVTTLLLMPSGIRYARAGRSALTIKGIASIWLWIWLLTPTLSSDLAEKIKGLSNFLTGSPHFWRNNSALSIGLK